MNSISSFDVSCSESRWHLAILEDKNSMGGHTEPYKPCALQGLLFSFTFLKSYFMINIIF